MPRAASRSRFGVFVWAFRPRCPTQWLRSSTAMNSTLGCEVFSCESAELGIVTNDARSRLMSPQWETRVVFEAKIIGLVLLSWGGHCDARHERLGSRLYFVPLDTLDSPQTEGVLNPLGFGRVFGGTAFFWYSFHRVFRSFTLSGNILWRSFFSFGSLRRSNSSSCWGLSDSATASPSKPAFDLAPLTTSFQSPARIAPEWGVALIKISSCGEGLPSAIVPHASRPSSGNFWS